MATPLRLIPLLEQFDWARKRLHDRLAGPEGDSGTGVPIEIPPMTDDEYLWEPVPNCWSIRPRTAQPLSSARVSGAVTPPSILTPGRRPSPPLPGDSAISARC